MGQETRGLPSPSLRTPACRKSEEFSARPRPRTQIRSEEKAQFKITLGRGRGARGNTNNTDGMSQDCQGQKLDKKPTPQDRAVSVLPRQGRAKGPYGADEKLLPGVPRFLSLVRLKKAGPRKVVGR